MGETKSHPIAKSKNRLENQLACKYNMKRVTISALVARRWFHFLRAPNRAHLASFEEANPS
jgi:hypothetical protein